MPMAGLRKSTSGSWRAYSAESTRKQRVTGTTPLVLHNSVPYEKGAIENDPTTEKPLPQEKQGR